MATAPPPRAQRQHVASWLRSAHNVVEFIGNYDRKSDLPLIRFLVHLEEEVFKIADDLPSRNNDPAVRPANHSIWHKAFPLEKIIKDKVKATLLHRTADPYRTLRRCTSAQKIIDEMARNRCWPLPWYGDYAQLDREWTQHALQQRARWVHAYWDMHARQESVYYEETRGFIEDEVVYLLSFHWNEGFPDPLINRATAQRFMNWNSMKRRLDEKEPWTLVNWDWYSSLFIECCLKPCDVRKPRARGTPKERVISHYNLVHLLTRDTISCHHWSNAVYTEEMAIVLVSLIQNTLDWLMHSDDFDWCFADDEIPRAIYEQLLVVVHGITLNRPARALSSRLLRTQNDPMPPEEVHHFMLRHIKRNRREPDPDPLEYDVDMDASDSASSRSSSRARRTKHMPKCGAPPQELVTEYWKMPVYNLENFPLIQDVRRNLESRIHDPSEKWGNVSVKDRDPRGKRNKEIDEDWIDNIIRDKWFEGGDDFPPPEGYSVAVPEIWPTVEAIYSNARGLKDALASAKVTQKHWKKASLQPKITSHPDEFHAKLTFFHQGTYGDHILQQRDTQAIRLPNTWAAEYLGSRILGFPNTWVPEYYGSRILGPLRACGMLPGTLYQGMVYTRDGDCYAGAALAVSRLHILCLLTTRLDGTGNIQYALTIKGSCPVLYRMYVKLKLSDSQAEYHNHADPSQAPNPHQAYWDMPARGGRVCFEPTQGIVEDHTLHVSSAHWNEGVKDSLLHRTASQDFANWLDIKTALNERLRYNINTPRIATSATATTLTCVAFNFCFNFNFNFCFDLFLDFGFVSA
ncbi:hypothetical protein CALCODRAFT_506812 [Calocera cornea HHB12733]|uniref:Uncharacterized protein n=1 Tax=Calocera cornea HHB12733 TaxID=1353952 RepID=A0A165IH36_9BASI|nr:hypothetical protein CALCODRAFT_506812 [Calocera cornea HHB12733]